MFKGNALKESATCLVHALKISIYFEKHTHEFVLETNHSVYRKYVHRTKGKYLAPWCHRPQSALNNSYKYNIGDKIILFIPT